MECLSSQSSSPGRPRLPCRTSTTLFLLLRTALLIALFPFTYAKDTEAVIYLASYGYLSPSLKNPSTGNLITEDAVSSAISNFQSFAGLNVTGEIDEETLQMMELPRCGVKDKVGIADSRSKRYALQGSRWKVKDLSFKISKYPKGLKPEQVDLEVKKAFEVWSEYTDLTFTQKKYGSVHIEIRFEKGEHGDGDPFDGPGGTLAHAYFPVYGGDAHFDDDEVWTIDTHRGTNLFQVAAHEFGHSLGLSHSDVRSALMAPFYRGFQPYFRLDEDDIEGIQVLYGKKSRGQSTKTPPRRPTTESTNSIDEDLELCTNGAMDTMFNSGNATYVFKNEKYWKLENEGVSPGYPKLISSSWKKLPSKLDAAFTYKNGKTYFFKGSQYWRYIGKTMDGDYPKPISSGFAGIPNDIDAAFVWSGNGKIYFFKGDQFWRFDPSQKPPVQSSYPKPIKNWEGVPPNVDAALQYTNGFTYFFKKGAYWRFNDRQFKVDAASVPFPRATAYWWYGCKEATSGTIGTASLTDEYKSDASSEHSGGLSVDDLILDAASTHVVPNTNIDSDEDGGGESSGSATTQTAIVISILFVFLYSLSC